MYNRVSLTFFIVFFIFGFTVKPVISYGSAYRYNEEGLALAKSGEYVKAIKAFEKALKQEPSSDVLRRNLMITYNNYGFYLKDKGDIKGSITQFKNALGYDELSPYTLYNLGQAYYLIQDMDNALKVLRQANILEPSLEGAGELIKKIERESVVEDDFEQIETEHFILAFSKNISRSDASYVKTYLEEAYGRVGELLDHYSEQKIVVLIYSENQYERLLRGMPAWSMAAYDNKIRIPAHKFKFTLDDVVKIIYHEYCHVLIRELTKGKAPEWISEGMASKAEEFAGSKDTGKASEYLHRFGFIPLENMPSDFTKIRNVDKAVHAYVMSYFMIDFIQNRYGDSGLRYILDKIAEGFTALYAVEKLFKEDIDIVEKQYREFVSGKYGMGVVSV